VVHSIPFPPNLGQQKILKNIGKNPSGNLGVSRSKFNTSQKNDLFIANVNHSYGREMVIIEHVTVEALLMLHDMAIHRYGGSAGVLHEGTLYHLVDGLFHYYDPLDRAAYVLHGIATMHPFFDGNKRTAFLAASAILAGQGMRIEATNEEVINFVLSVAQGKKTELQVRRWMYKHHEYTHGY
jgi:death-on-curing protein